MTLTIKQPSLTASPSEEIADRTRTDGTGSTGPGLWVGLDRLKALCVAGMLIAHGFYWAGTSGGEVLFDRDDPLLAWIALCGLGVGILPVLLPFCAGIASRWRMRAGALHQPRLRTFVWPALLLYGLNGVMNWGAAGYGGLWAWNVLALVGLGLLLLGVCLRLGVPPLGVGAIGFALLLVGDPLRSVLGVNDQSSDVLRILFGDPTDWHTWSIVPWLPTFFIGFAAGEVRAHCANPRRAHQVFATAALLFIAIATATGELGQPFDAEGISSPLVMTPPALRVLGLLGIALLLLALLDGGRLWRYGPIHCYSAGILPIYLAHLMVGHRVYSATPVAVREALLKPDQGMSRVFYLLACLLLVFAFSWIVGYLWLQLTDRRLHIRIRRVDAVS